MNNDDNVETQRCTVDDNVANREDECEDVNGKKSVAKFTNRDHVNGDNIFAINDNDKDDCNDDGEKIFF